jgi:hypothetical protein
VADEKLSPERAVRLLRAKAGEMEHWVLHNANKGHPEIWQLTADIALIASILADHIEQWRSVTTPRWSSANITQEMLESKRDPDYEAGQ